MQSPLLGGDFSREGIQCSPPPGERPRSDIAAQQIIEEFSHRDLKLLCLCQPFPVGRSSMDFPPVIHLVDVSLPDALAGGKTCGQCLCKFKLAGPARPPLSLLAISSKAASRKLPRMGQGGKRIIVSANMEVDPSHAMVVPGSLQLSVSLIEEIATILVPRFLRSR